MPALARTIEDDCYNHAANDACINGGSWTRTKYKYNTLGELVEQTDAKGQVAYMAYDLLGRLIERVEPEGITTWTYDTLRKGALTSVEGPNYRRSYTYHPWGAVDKEIIGIASMPPPPSADCTAPLTACGNLPPGVLPEDPVGTVVGLLCNSYPGVCDGDVPEPPLEEVVGLIQNLCSKYPGACPGVPIDPQDPVAGLLGYLCAHSTICEQLPPDYVQDPVAAILATLCGLNLCVVSPPTEPDELVEALQSFLAGLASKACYQYQVGPITIDMESLCDSLPAPPPFLFASAITPPGTAVFGPRISAGLPTDDATMVQFEYAHVYDTAGRLREVTYPSGLRVTNNYDPASGALTKVTDPSGYAYWEATDWDKWGNIRAATLGNGVQTSRSFEADTGRLSSIYAVTAAGGLIQDLRVGWDLAGNLKYREDGKQGWLREDFDYDELNRLRSATLSNLPSVGTLPSLTMNYSANGNIASKSGVGDYAYGAQPHAVLAAGNSVYSYDANGNMLSGAGRVYTWASYNLPTAISSGAGSSAFLYGPERQRIRQLSTDATSSKLIYYVGSLYEEHQHGSTIEKKHYISTPSGIVAVETWDSSVKREYLHTDHLGSVVAITGDAGQLKQQLAYDAFGKRRGVVVAGAVEGMTQAFLTPRGFTGHEHLDNLDLIHMNGRVYDPLLGRFLSADPFVQAPGNTQSHNRYSYVMNNPLTLTDPSGYFSLRKTLKRAGNWIKDHRRIIIAVALAAVTYGAVSSLVTSSVFNGGLAAAESVGEIVALGNSASAAGAIAGGASAGAVSGGVITGSVRGAIKGAVTGAVLAGPFAAFGHNYSMARVAGDGVAGGVGSELQGGKFKDGFMAGAGLSLLAYGNYKMRDAMREQSCQTSHNCNGVSDGFFGDGTKLGGTRRTEGDIFGPCKAPLGGCQGAPFPGDQRSYFPLVGEYASGSIFDTITESFAGPHDMLRDFTGSYTASGNAVPLTGVAGFADKLVNGILVAPAAPFAGGALVNTNPWLTNAALIHRGAR